MKKPLSNHAQSRPKHTMRKTLASSLVALTALSSTAALAENQDRPNILVIWGDDIGLSNVSALSNAIMGYRTPNIDRIAKEGVIFSEHYAQPSSTAGRASFITGQYPIRSGMVTVGQPGSDLGLQAESPTLAELLKDHGYRTGHFGKNHLGDRNEHLPTMHGFDEFYGNLYHLNTEEEAEQRDYQNFAKKFSGSLEEYEKAYGARGVIHSIATDTVDETEDPRFGVVGKQTIEDTGPLDRKRMETFDSDEVIPRTIKFMEDSKDSGEPFFVWMNPSRMHLYTHLPEDWRYAAEDQTAEYDLHGSGMLQHDHDIGTILDWLDEQGLAENTIVWYSSDNGVEHSSWPHGGTTPFRGEKMTTYEGGVRVPSMLRWPGVVPAGLVQNGIQAHMDMFTTLAVAAGIEDPVKEVKEKMNQYIDGVNNLDYWKGESESHRDHIFHYYESQLTAVRVGPWKFHFATKENYYDTMTQRSMPLMFNLHADPFESYDHYSGGYGHLAQKVSWLMAPIGTLMQEHVKTLQEFPPVQKGTSLNMSEIIENSLNPRQ